MNDSCRRASGLTRQAFTTLSLSLVPLLLGGFGRMAAQERPRYSLDLRFEPGDSVLIGRATVAAGASHFRGGLARFSTSVSGGRTLEILRITLPGAEQPVSWSGPDENGVVHVPVPDTGSGARITFDYRLAVDGATFRPFGYYIFEGISGWAYPRLVDDTGAPFDFADFDVELERPASLAVLTTGGTGDSGREGSLVRTRYRAEHVRGFAIVAGEGYRVERPERGDTPVVAFFHPDREERFRFAIERTKEAAEWYERTYGFFPLREIGIVQGHPRWIGGYPLPNMFALHLGSLEDEHLTWITAHELGHYYWGGTVLADPRERDWLGLDWLQLALGIWSDQRYLAERGGIPLPEQWRRNERQGDWFAGYLEAVLGNREQRLDLTPTEASGLDFDYNTLVRHGKAATGLYLLSLRLGADRFLDFQRRLLEEYRFEPISSETLVEELEAAGLAEAGPFLTAWRAGDAMIGAAVEAVGPEKGGEGWGVSIRRTGTVPYPVTVEVGTATGRERHVVPADARVDTVRVPSRPRSVRLDPDGEIPMWNSSHPGIRAAYLRAMERVGLDAPFIPLATEYLRNEPEEAYLRYRLIRRLYRMGRWDEGARLWPADRRRCEVRDECLAAIYAARARNRAGRVREARALLDALRGDAARTDALALWEIAHGELPP